MINYTVKMILRDHAKNEKGESAIYIRITIARKTAYIATGHFVSQRHWNEKSETIKDINPEAKTKNPELSFRKNEIVKKIVSLQVAHKEFTAKSVKELFLGKDLHNIFNFIEAFCQEVKHKKNDQTILVYEKHVRKLEEYTGSRLVNFEDVTPAFLSGYEKHLRSTGASNNYVHAIWKTLKTFFNAAIKRKIITDYPFSQYENPIYKDPQKDYLTLAELKRWEDFADETDNDILKQAAVYFLLGCYSGLRISDWRLFNIKTNVNNGRINLRAKKNGEWVSIPINGPMERNLERIKLLPLTIEEPTINEKLKVICKKIGVTKKISSHCARKSFAVTMCADQGISSETCATLMGITIDVCIRNYYEITDAKINNEVIRAWASL